MNYQTNKLYGKTAVFNGDSITAGSKVWGSWADRIAEKNSMTYKNYGVGGGTLTENVLFSSGEPRHSISATLELILSVNATVVAFLPRANFIASTVRLEYLGKLIAISVSASSIRNSSSKISLPLVA